jgi:hypothetical protein
MSEPENFVARWSRRKRETATQEKPEADDTNRLADAKARAGQAEAEQPASSPSPPPFDPATLPPIESITAGTDVRAFLQSGVPADLTRAALRRAWTSDPAIRDFIGLAENQWDFTDPNGVPGFGPLQPGDDIGKLVSQAMGKIDELTQPATAQATPPAETSHQASLQATGMPGETPCIPCASNAVENEQSPEDAAPQHEATKAEPNLRTNRRGHGGALPQ